MILDEGRYAQVDTLLEEIHLYLFELARELALASGQGSAYQTTMRAAAQITFVRRALLAEEKILVEGEKLSQREKEVLGLLIKGQTNLQIGHVLKIAEKTVEKHVESIMRKFDVDSRVEVAVRAVREGVV